MKKQCGLPLFCVLILWGINLAGAIFATNHLWGATAARAEANPPAGAVLAPGALTATTPLTGVVQIVAGYSHTCARTSMGGVKCWGGNYYGQLGIDGADIRSTPVDVIGLSDVASAISAGGDHVCALLVTGGIQCWGDNRLGQVGNSAGPWSSTPVDVVGLGRENSAVSVGARHTCALTTTGNVKCWGRNSEGQLGNGDTANSSRPVDVIGLNSEISAISAGGAHVCALTTAGGVKCWGRNDFGELGNDSTANSSTPVDVVGLSSGIKAISAGGGYTCALTTAGGVKCWGVNFDGELGNGNTVNSSVPVDVVDLSSGVMAITVGTGHGCALLTTGDVKCWGWGIVGQLGNGATFASSTPVAVTGLDSNISAISAGASHTCALSTTGSVKCWGDNTIGELGDGTAGFSATPVDVTGLSSGVSATGGGGLHNCVLLAAGSVKCWGWNENGQLGNGSTDNSNTPIDVVGLSGVSAISVGERHTCALLTTGGIKCWGAKSDGQMGDSNTPVDVAGLTSGVSAVGAGDGYSCALLTAGGVKCWGVNGNGQLGNGSLIDSSTPVDVVGLSNAVSAISTGASSACALSTAGEVKCWGSINNNAPPAVVPGLNSGVSAVSVGSIHACILTTAGGVQCWGANYDGQLGDGSMNDSSTPVDVVGLSSGVSAISTGYSHTCALTTAGGVKCWGANGRSELGNGTTIESAVPVDVVDLQSGVSAISAGTSHTCALTIDGGVKCWGTNYDGELGDGNAWKTTPVDVVTLVLDRAVYLPLIAH
ncbi:MAG: hypothetical protein R3A44_41600 [Caldilineaceae bacterium]